MGFSVQHLWATRGEGRSPHRPIVFCLGRNTVRGAGSPGARLYCIQEGLLAFKEKGRISATLLVELPGIEIRYRNCLDLRKTRKLTTRNDRERTRNDLRIRETVLMTSTPAAAPSRSVPGSRGHVAGRAPRLFAPSRNSRPDGSQWPQYSILAAIWRTLIQYDHNGALYQTAVPSATQGIRSTVGNRPTPIAGHPIPGAPRHHPSSTSVGSGRAL